MKCEYCTGENKDREFLINRKHPRLYVLIDKHNNILACDGASYEIYPISFCPNCGRELKGECE